MANFIKRKVELGSMRLHVLGCITASHIGSLDVFLVKSKASRPQGPPITPVTFLWGRIGLVF